MPRNFKDQSPVERSQALWLYHEVKEKPLRLASAALELLNDPDETVLTEALEALKPYPEGTLPKLIQRCKSGTFKKDDTRYSVLNAIKKLEYAEKKKS